ncbi:BPSS1187 family protein [Erythrobacter oryzae]|uniref:BPSS1187 family protein n=1 Tax=Erythrobacter oryzae TaxID=3019556 RepID=UPI00255605E7|nr:hypothetical protein [Erythrobacter sp. COR-2]
MIARSLSRTSALAAFLALTACGGGGSAPAPAPTPTPSPTPTPTPSPTSTERNILPADTSAAITTNLQAHFVINPDPQVPAKGRLFVMLPGTGGIPAVYRDIVRTGAARGYHALGLTYPNDEAVERLCGSSVDPDCTGKVRREIITGEDTSPLVAVNAANAIITRLTVLLQFLERTYPAEGWGQFLSGGRPDWSRITIAGHSQGGGHAGYFAKLVALDRAVMFAAPADSGLAPASTAPWLSLPNVTPADRQYGFIHVDDPLVPLATANRAWEAIGMGAFGPLTSVDGSAAPFGNSRRLTTAAAPNPNPTGPSASPAHGAPVLDSVTPRDAQGRPVFAPVWNYLAFP